MQNLINNAKKLAKFNFYNSKKFFVLQNNIKESLKHIKGRIKIKRFLKTAKIVEKSLETFSSI